MNTSRRVTISFLVAAIVLSVGILFWPFVLNNIIKPTALVVWFLLRTLVLSVNQKYCWYTFVFVAVVFLFRFVPQGRTAIQPDVYLETNATLDNIEYWRVRFAYDSPSMRDEKTLKRELLYLLTSLYASKQSTSINFDIYTALQQGKIPLPEHIHTFLLSQEPQESIDSVITFFQSIRETFRKQIRQWTGQEKAEHYQTIAEILNFMETSLEIMNDDRKSAKKISEQVAELYTKVV